MRGNIHGVEDRAEVRLLQERDVGVPPTPEVDLVVRFGDDLDDLWVVLHALDEGVGIELAEPAPEGDLAGGGEVLVPEEQDVVLDQRRSQLVDGALVEVGGEVDAAHLGSEVARDRCQGDVRGRGGRIHGGRR